LRRSSIARQSSFPAACGRSSGCAARSLVHDPDLLILDEPTAGVDPLSRRQFWDLIGRMREQRADMTVIVATAQSFSLYTELTVRQNLRLHARLFHLPRAQARQRIRALIQQFGLGEHVDTEAASLPLGIRQRLSLAVAVVHEPDLLILDEPTSGVDPLALDAFWELLIDLSRRRGVTIFVSTHFMNEAERCDRIAMMHAGRVLAIGTPAELVAKNWGPSPTCKSRRCDASSSSSASNCPTSWSRWWTSRFSRRWQCSYSAFR
jgi:ABC-type multidrug transport system ATPase subunit